MHYDEQAVSLAREMLLITLKIAAPILGAGLIIGLLVSLVQSITSIQDQTLSFVPKIVAMIAAAALLLPWIVAKLVAYAGQLLSLASGA
ncbi:MAG: flagellar biosynthetic protein FliQ [Phycisphaerae bacterium]|nr:flagellar biosynthetic protein FliQ [Phycisphaerae bacterium]